MIQSKDEYLKKFASSLKSYNEGKSIVLEVELHISELLHDLMVHEHMDEMMAMEKICERLGAPEQLAVSYKRELNVTQSKTQWTFIIMNCLFFIGGICLTFLNQLNQILFIEHLWELLTSIPMILVFLYMVFWGLVGYEIGKEFGRSGVGLLYKTFYISLVPNLTLMFLVLFQIVPAHWFDPLLTPWFIVACIIGTVFLYPIAILGFRWGTSRSL